MRRPATGLRGLAALAYLRDADLLRFPKCTGEMRIISFIYKKTVIKKILMHLGVFEKKRNQRAPPRSAPEYIESPEIVPYDDVWPGYDEPVVDFLK